MPRKQKQRAWDLATEEEQQAFVAKLLERPANFGCRTEGMFKHFALGPIVNAAHLSAQDARRAQRIVTVFKKLGESIEPDKFDDREPTWWITQCRHWAVAWVDHLSFKVFADDVGTPSKYTIAMYNFYFS